MEFQHHPTSNIWKVNQYICELFVAVSAGAIFVFKLRITSCALFITQIALSNTAAAASTSIKRECSC